MNKQLITVFTPTYNRAHLLPRLYESLKDQTDKRFQWLIIDDSSDDNTEEVVNDIKSDPGLCFEVTYVRHRYNKGMCAAHNTAYALIETEYVVCIDSDDYLLDDSIEVLINELCLISKDESVGGVIGLDIYHGSGEVIGDLFPHHLKYSTFSELKFGHKVKGDKKFAYKSNVVKKYPPYPEYGNEKFPAAGYLYRLIDRDFKLKIVNRPLCIVDYQPTGNTRRKVDHYFRDANAFLDYRLMMLPIAYNFSERLRMCIHLSSSAFITGKFSSVFSGDYKIIKAVSLPLGFLLYLSLLIRRT